MILNERINSVLFKISDYESRILNVNDPKIDGYPYLITDLNNQYRALKYELDLLTQ